jgi:hypothetical protein
MAIDEVTSSPTHNGNLLQELNDRSLQASTSCYCAAVEFVDGAPTEREFSERYNQDVQLAAASNLFGGSQYTITFLNEHVDPNLVTSPPRTYHYCDTAAECIAANQGSVCVSNECLRDGNPRFTLTWTGDDDLDLSVVTPAGVNISYQNDFDATTNGAFDTGFVQDVYGSHVESIYFPTGLGGTYHIFVAQFAEQGEGDDNWTLQVFVGGAMVGEISGEGSDADEENGGIIYDHTQQTLTASQMWSF